MSTLDLDTIRADLEYASSRIDGPDTLYHPHALRAMRVAEKLLAEVDRLRVELRDAGNDLLDVRGILSPNGYPCRVPVDLVPTVAPAVQWLVDEVERLRQNFEDAHADRLYGSIGDIRNVVRTGWVDVSTVDVWRSAAVSTGDGTDSDG